MEKKQIKFRCSALGALLTEPRSKSEILSGTCKDALIEAYVNSTWKRYSDNSNKYTEKGLAREEDAITLLSRVNKIFYKKNNVRLTNDFITGEVDCFEGISIDKAKHTLDTKCSWDALNFFKAKKNNQVDKNYYAQGQGYMWLTGATKHTIAYCLTNCTDKHLTDAIRSLNWKLGVIDEQAALQDLNYIKKRKQIEINMIFDIDSFIGEYPYIELVNEVRHNLTTDTYSWDYDIPMEQRVHLIEFERDEAFIERIIECYPKWIEWIDNNFKNQ